MLSDRQMELYQYLLDSFLIDPDKWVSQTEICKQFPTEYTLNHKAVNKMCCSYMHQDVMKINENKITENIILYKNQTYKIAKDAEEAKRFLKSKLLIKGCNMLKRYWSLLKKVNNDGQMTLEGDEIKTFIESHLKEEDGNYETTA